MSEKDYTEWFARITGVESAWAWQQALASRVACENQLIRIPTGMGKTLGVLSAWVFHRLERQHPEWPRRLVWCLPMRTLVEQTASEAERFLNDAGFSDKVSVFKLLGGVEESRWFEWPERVAVLIGTQDMLLSRALNRGYAMGRAAWPNAFGLINNDALWVMDEVQLMGVGLTTSAQIQSFWQRFASRHERFSPPRVTWWMSATLQPDWLQSPETTELVETMKSKPVVIPPDQRSGVTWDAQKPVSLEPSEPTAWAELISRKHADHTPDSKTGRQTLVIVNTVKTANQVFDALNKNYKKSDSPPELKLIHSRFRPHERQTWAEFLQRSALTPDTNRIIVATQVVEAGVDISASCLITELAPWTSLVQRFGRAARYGGTADVDVLDNQPTDDKKAAPYQLAEIDAARSAIKDLIGRSLDVSIRSLEQFEDELRASSPELLQGLYPYQPLHVLLQHEFEELFDTSPDLTGADLDVGRFIREGEDRDLQVFWRELPNPLGDEIVPSAQELCAVPIGDAKAWIKKISTERGMVYSWDYLDGKWIPTRSETLRPGMVILVNARAGGYDPELGFTGQPLKKGRPGLDIQSLAGLNLVSAEISEIAADQMESSDGLSQQQEWKTILTHSREARAEANRLSEQLGLPSNLRQVVEMALRLHDWGKSHPTFALGTYCVVPSRTDLAKAPEKAWRTGAKLYQTESHGPRRGFRHELASCLAILELIRRCHPEHPAINGRDFAWMWDITNDRPSDEPTTTNAIADELSRLSFQEVDLLLFLIAAHHGKVRLSMQSSPKDQEFETGNTSWAGTGMPIRGVRQGDEVLPVRLPDSSGGSVEMPALALNLEVAAIGLSERYGRSWTERMIGLLSQYSPFGLGYLESIVRAADVRASRLTTADP
ncbi:MAG TPA: CRISPR-associated helicase Cas3' [Pirellulaceae bacterium]|nr:CRISPR-associated helicase Cas3' [Pirellulaceae bacterium]